MTISLICAIIAIVLFVLNAIYPKPWNALGFGLAFLALSLIITGGPVLHPPA